MRSVVRTSSFDNCDNTELTGTTAIALRNVRRSNELLPCEDLLTNSRELFTLRLSQFCGKLVIHRLQRISHLIEHRKPFFRDRDIDDAPIFFRTFTLDEPLFFQRIDSARNVRRTVDHPLANFSAGMAFWMHTTK